MKSSHIPEELAYIAICRKDLKFFLMEAYKKLYPNKPFLDNWHIDAIIHCLRSAIEHGKLPRLIINMPPRHLKSFIISVVLPAFILGRDPAAKIICVSYSDDLGKSLSREFNRLIETNWYQRVFPDLRTSKMTETEFVTESGGGRYSTSVGGTLTGRGGDVIIVDDPIKAEDAYSDIRRQRTNQWLNNTLISRLDDKARGLLIIVMQRLHATDLTGYLEGRGYHKLALSAIAIQDESIPIGDEANHMRREGEALHPEWESLSTLEHQKGGRAGFRGLFATTPQDPVKS